MADILSRLADLALTEQYLPGKEGYKYGYTMFEQLHDIYVDSSKCGPVLSVDVSYIDVSVMKKENSKVKGIQLGLSTKELINGQSNDTFCSTMLKLMNDKEVPLDKYFISDTRL